MPEGEDFLPSRMSLVDFNIQVTSFSENATPNEHIGLHAHSKLISPSTLGEPQTLFSPFAVIESMFESLKGNICLMRVLDDEWSWKYIIKYCDEF